MDGTNCLFCRIAEGTLPAAMIYRDEWISVFLDIDPIDEGHILIVPNAHVLDVDEMDDETLLRIMRKSKELVAVLKAVFRPAGYTIMQNGGKYNDIGHYHLHIFPRSDNDGFGWKFGDNDFGSRLEETRTKILAYMNHGAGGQGR